MGLLSFLGLSGREQVSAKADRAKELHEKACQDALRRLDVLHRQTEQLENAILRSRPQIQSVSVNVEHIAKELRSFAQKCLSAIASVQESIEKQEEAITAWRGLDVENARNTVLGDLGKAKTNLSESKSFLEGQEIAIRNFDSQGSRQTYFDPVRADFVKLVNGISDGLWGTRLSHGPLGKARINIEHARKVVVESWCPAAKSVAWSEGETAAYGRFEDWASHNLR